uniref:Uncharacterized protein n=1 Tax=Anguilla anguilla TaxID=7936 RepID=A0A0E9T2F3_ANGAN
MKVTLASLLKHNFKTTVFQAQIAYLPF